MGSPMSQVIWHHMQVFTIVGGGRVGTALEDMASESVSLLAMSTCPWRSMQFLWSHQCCSVQVMVARGEPMPQVKSGPIVVCTRNDDLDGVVAATPEERRKGKWMTSM